MVINLQNLMVKNFKGIKNLELNFNGENAVIAGQNGTGKTTVADAWFWLLTGSNLDGQSKYNIIELDDGSMPVDHQEAEVVATILANEKTIYLKKIYKQLWTKKRGQAESNFTGHTTEHFWNDTPVSAKEYQSRLDMICPSSIIRALTDVHFFCSRLKPSDRRQELINLAGDLSLEAICSDYPELKELPEIVGDQTVSDVLAMLKHLKKQLQRELKEIPIEINAKREEIEDFENINVGDVKAKIVDLEEKISKKKNELVAVNNGLISIELRQKKADLESKLFSTESQLRKEFQSDSEAQIKIKNKAVYERGDKLDRMDTLNREMANIDRKIGNLEDDKKKLVDAFRAAKSGDNICHCCGQNLPQDQIDKQLDSINRDGMQIKDKIESLKAEKKNKHAEFMKYSEESEYLRSIEGKAVEVIEGLTDDLQASIKSAKDPIINEIKEIEDKIGANDNDAEKKELESEIALLQSQCDGERTVLASIAQAEKTMANIRGKEKKLKHVAMSFEATERKLYMLELYSRKRSEYIEETVSKKFEITAWKLFEDQVNQGIREICEPTYNGIPYSTDLNTGAKIQVGLDVIKALSKHNNINMPIFIDNSESVTDWLVDVENQLVKLVANSEFKELEIING